MDEYRTVQVFLSPKASGIFEVEMTRDGSSIRCNCPTFKVRSRCRHTKYVQLRMDESGSYPIMVHHSTNEQEMFAAVEDRDLFRQFVIKYSHIEVL